MRITIVQGAFLPVPPLMGGAEEKICFALGEEFARCGHQVTHISRAYQNLPAEEMIEGVRHLRVSGFDTPKSLIVLKLFDLVYSWRVLQILPEADILITSTFWMPILVRNPKYGALYVRVGRYPKGQMRFYRHAARLQALSSAIASAIIQQEPKIKSKVRVIPNVVPKDLSCVDITQFHHQRQKQILYVGRIHPEKGIDLLISAFEKIVSSGVNDWQLVIVGSWDTKFGGGGEVYYESIQRKCRAAKHQIEWVGLVTNSTELSSYYKQALLFVYPSLAEKGEAFGLAPLEAMAHGCPPLVSNLECFQDFIEDNTNGYVFDHRSSNAIDNLTKKLIQLTSIEDCLLRTGKYSFETAQKYTVQHVAKLHFADFETLIK